MLKKCVFKFFLKVSIDEEVRKLYGSPFHTIGPEYKKARSDFLKFGGGGCSRRKKSLLILRFLFECDFRVKRLLRYAGAKLLIHLKQIKAILYIMRYRTGRKWSFFR